MSLILSGTGALTLPSGSVLSAAPATGDRTAAIATMSKFLDEFGSSLASSGYQKLPSGLIVQWGSVSNTASASSTGTFPIAFPTASFAVVITGLQGTGNQQAYAVLNSHNATGFVWNAFFAGGGSAPVLSGTTAQVQGRFIAIGN